MDGQYTQEKRAEESTQEGAQENRAEGEVLFEIRTGGGYTDKGLQREFGALVLSHRPLWNKVCEVMVIVSMVILMLVFLEMGTRPKEAFLGWFVQGLCIGFAIGCAIVAVWGVIFMWLVRPRLVGRKRLATLIALKEQPTIRFCADALVSTSEGTDTVLSYSELPWSRTIVGEHALYLEVKDIPLFSVLVRSDFTVGAPTHYPHFSGKKPVWQLRRSFKT